MRKHLVPQNPVHTFTTLDKINNQIIKVMEKYRVNVYKNRTEWYNLEGELHRVGGPAIERADGFKAWYQNNRLHRTDGPAVEWVNGFRSWYQNGKLHRIGGPAIERVGGFKAWYQNDKLHRTDGPAMEYADGDKVWYLEDIEYTEEEFNKKMLENQNYNFGRYVLILESIDYDIETSLLIIQDEDELNKFIDSFEKEVTGGSSKIKLILDTTNMKYYDGDSWKQTSLITWSQYIGDYGF